MGERSISPRINTTRYVSYPASIIAHMLSIIPITNRKHVSTISLCLAIINLFKNFNFYILNANSLRVFGVY